MRKIRDSKVASRVRRRKTRVSRGISQATRGRFGKRTRGAQRNARREPVVLRVVVAALAQPTVSPPDPQRCMR